jgi:hypothetical protein
MSNNHPWNKMAILLACLILIKVSCAYTQCTSVQNSGSAFTTVPLAGANFSFTNATNLAVSDNNQSSSFTLLSITSGHTHYVRATNFGFSIPPTAIICGIVAEVEKSASGILFTSVTDRIVRLVRNSIITGNNLAQGGSWSSSESYTSYGSSSNTWGDTWMPADINSNNFGIVISANISGLGIAPTAMIDHVRLTVHYYIPPVLSIKNFDLFKSNNDAVLHWTGETAQYEVQRSADNGVWETIGYVQKNSFTDEYPLPGRSYYRIVTIDASGNKNYSVSRTLLLPDLVRVHCYPNPFTLQVLITGVPSGQQVLMTNVLGKRVRCKISNHGNAVKFDAAGLEPGMYIISAGNYHKKLTKL